MIWLKYELTNVYNLLFYIYSDVPVIDKERISIAHVNGVIGVEKLIRRKPLPRPWVTV